MFLLRRMRPQPRDKAPSGPPMFHIKNNPTFHARFFGHHNPQCGISSFRVMQAVKRGLLKKVQMPGSKGGKELSLSLVSDAPYHPVAGNTDGPL